MEGGCTICLEKFTACGTHQATSLACGHLFGGSCIEKWIRMKKSFCPNCHARATKRDLRTIFVPSCEFKIEDNAKEKKLQAELETEKRIRIELEIENAKLRLLNKNLLQSNSNFLNENIQSRKRKKVRDHQDDDDLLMVQSLQETEKMFLNNS